MTAYNADIGGKNPVRAVRRGLTILRMSVPIGATGAVGTITKDDGAWGLTRTGVGTYTGTFPISAYGDIRVTYVGDGTVKGHYFTAFDPTAGTFAITFHNGAGSPTPAATDPESTAVLRFRVELDEGV